MLSTSVYPQKEFYEGREPTYLARGVRKNFMAEVEPWEIDLDLSRGLLKAAIPRGDAMQKAVIRTVTERVVHKAMPLTERQGFY